jgi:phosphatidylglycerophosphate synthase
MRLEAPFPDECEPDDDFLEIGRAAVQIGAAKRLHDEEMDMYIPKLRRKLPPYLFRIRNEQSRREVEQFLFASNYKGSTDFLTKWVYPPMVWAMLKPLAARRVKPNTVTAVGIAACVMSIPFFAAGMWVPAVILAYVMSVLDSVDGKLARVTFQSTPQGDVLDHATDYIHPPFWYTAWAWGLSGGVATSGIFVASLWMTVFYILDRVMEVLFKACTGTSVHGYTEFDAKVRTVISRRNVNLAIITVALPLGLGEPAFYFMAAWQGVCFLFHLVRVAMVWNTRERPLQVTQPFAPAPSEASNL